jgi:hypothetical protein
MGYGVPVFSASARVVFFLLLVLCWPIFVASCGQFLLLDINVCLCLAQSIPFEAQHSKKGYQAITASQVQSKGSRPRSSWKQWIIPDFGHSHSVLGRIPGFIYNLEAWV